MINIKAKNIEEAVYQAYIELFENEELVSDPSLVRETAAVFEISNELKPKNYFKLEEGILSYAFPHKKYLPSVEIEKIEEELRYWESVLISPQVKEQFIEHLKNAPHSKRILIDLWKESHFIDLEKGAACITQMYFKKKGDYLEFHTHARANDVHRCMLMDMHMMSAIHLWVADAVNLKIGKYIHFVDALHFYKKFSGDIEAQYKNLKTKGSW